jgi:hypothetical protein
MSLLGGMGEVRVVTKSSGANGLGWNGANYWLLFSFI